MPITVDTVPAGTRKPGAYLDISTNGAKIGLPSTAVRVMLIGTQLGGTATAEVPVQVSSYAEARALFGDGTPLTLMVKAILEQNPNLSALYATPLAEAASSVAASGTIAFSVSGLTAGTLYVYIGRHVVRLGVTASDTASTIATALAAAVEANAELPVSGSSSTSTVTLANKVKGTQGNKWVWYVDYTGSGLTATVTQPTSGATDADIQDALDAIKPDQWDLIVAEWNDATSLDALVDHLDLVAGPMELRPGCGVTAFVGSVSSASTLASGRNSGRLTCGYMRGTRTHPMEMAAAYAGLIAAESDVARPLNGLELAVGVIPDTLTNRLTRTEQETLLLNGVAPFEVVGSQVQLVRSVSTYVTDASSSADDTLLDLQTIRTLDYVRYVCRTRVRSELARVKIADSATGPNTTDPDKIRSLLLGVLHELEAGGYVENVSAWKDRLVVERDPGNVNRVNAAIPADIVDGLHVFAGSIDLILS